MRNSEDQRQIGARIVSLIRSRRATSRRGLADQLRLSPTTAGQYVDQLIGAACLDESGLEKPGVGRPKRILTTVAAAGWFAGVESNADRVQAVAVNFSGELEASRTVPLSAAATTRSVLAEISKSVSALARQMSVPLLGIGVGAPGVVDTVSGRGVHYSFLPDWRDVPIADRLHRGFDVPVAVENNLRAIALAERWFGGRHDLDDYVILGPRSGFGIAIVKHGQLIGGAHHSAGEIGLWPWPLHGRAGGSDVGQRGQLHDALSAPAVWRRLAGKGARAKLTGDLRAALAGLALETGPGWDGVIEDFATVLGSVQLLIDAHTYLLHGPLTALGEKFCRAIAERAAQRIPALRSCPLRIEPSGLGDDAGALGAASMAMEAWLPGA